MDVEGQGGPGFEGDGGVFAEVGGEAFGVSVGGEDEDACGCFAGVGEEAVTVGVGGLEGWIAGGDAFLDGVVFEVEINECGGMGDGASGGVDADIVGGLFVGGEDGEVEGGGGGEVEGERGGGVVAEDGLDGGGIAGGFDADEGEPGEFVIDVGEGTVFAVVGFRGYQDSGAASLKSPLPMKKVKSGTGWWVLASRTVALMLRASLRVMVMGLSEAVKDPTPRQ